MVNIQHSLVDICILIPCYNNTEGLILSINSIVYHPGRFQVIVVDDGSARPITREELYQHIPVTVNIQVIRLKQNGGVSNALNMGLDAIYNNYPARFIARLDCGDTCSSERFFRQVSFLDNNPGIDLLGTWCYFKNMQTGSAYEYITPARHELIERSMYFRNVFVHPTVMWRVSSLHGWRYPENYPHAEDYGLFYDMITKKRTAILDEFLVVCEINKQGISLTNRSAQLKSRLRVIWDYGENKLWLAAGTIKLLLLMVFPYQFIYQVKTWMYKRKFAEYRNH